MREKKKRYKNGKKERKKEGKRQKIEEPMTPPCI